MSAPEPLHLRFDAFELDERDARLSRDGQPLAIAPKAFAVLCTLVRHPGQLVTKNELLDAVWGHQHVSESVLKTLISELRSALADDAKAPRYIETASRRGYRFIGAIREAPQNLVAASPNERAAPLPNEPPAPAQSLIGRQSAFGRLHAAWNHALNGRRQIVWVVGEAGVGKTTLIDHFVSGLGDAVRTHGQCVEQTGAGEPYLPVLEALATLCRHDPSLSSLLRSVAPTWLIQLPWLSSEVERDALQRELSGASQDRMLRELGEFLDRYTGQRPLLLVTEDLHWSDHATIRLIDHIARRRGAARLMWLATFRLAEVVSEDHPLKSLRHELRLHKLCEEIMLDPFSEREVADYVESRIPDARIPEDFVRRLHNHTDGLPLFVVNVLDELQSDGALQRQDEHTLARMPVNALQVPENLAGVIEKQIARLPAELRVMLEAASVCGVEFRPVTVAHALERDTRWVGERCDALMRRQHWLRQGEVERLPDGSLQARYAFRHALYRHVFYQRIGALTCMRLHHLVARSLEDSRAAGDGVTAAELAAHYESSHDLVPALRYFAEAVEGALRRFAPTEARSLADHALSILTRVADSPERDALELAITAMGGVATAQLHGVSSLAAKHAFERAQTLLENLPQHPLRGLILHGLGLVLLVRGEYEETRGFGERVHELGSRHGDRLLQLSACSVLGQVNALQGRYLDARKWLEQGLTACKDIGDASLAAAFVVDPGVTMHAALAVVLWNVGLADQARRSIGAALDRAQRLGQPMGQMVALWFGGLLEVRLENPRQVAAYADDLRAVVETASLAQGTGASRWFRGWAEAKMGHADTAYRTIRDAYEHNAGLGMLSGGTEVLGYAVEALLLSGDICAAQSEVDTAIQLAHTLAERVNLTQLALLRARIARAQGDAEAARQAKLAALQEARRQQAISLEIMALAALCEDEDALPDHRLELAQACSRLQEGFDTPLVRRARELIGASAPPAS